MFKNTLKAVNMSETKSAEKTQPVDFLIIAKLPLLPLAPLNVVIIWLDWTRNVTLWLKEDVRLWFFGIVSSTF